MSSKYLLTAVEAEIEANDAFQWHYYIEFFDSHGIKVDEFTKISQDVDFYREKTCV